MRFVSFTTVDIKTPNQERIVRDKVKISDDVNKTSKKVTLAPMWQIDFIDDVVFDVQIETDTDGTWYYLVLGGHHAS